VPAKNDGVFTEITVRAKPGAKVPGITVDDGIVTVRVRQRAVEGAANEAVVEALAQHLRIPKARIRIERGEKSRQKRVRITGLDETAVAAALELGE